MKEEEILRLLQQGNVRKRSPDLRKVDSLIHSAEADAKAADSRPIDELQASLVFRAVYDAFRKLGDAWWWKNGFQLQKNWHELSLKALAEAPIQASYKLKDLDRFRRIRNDNEYDGYLIKAKEAHEIFTN